MEYFLIIILLASGEGRRRFCSMIKELEQPFFPRDQLLSEVAVQLQDVSSYNAWLFKSDTEIEMAHLNF